jgi:dienelactone hydrolase
MHNAIHRIFVTAVLVVLSSQLSRADESSQKELTAALQQFTLPEIPAELKQKLRDYVPNDLKRRRDEGNARSTAEWEKIKTREEWEAFRKEKVKLLRESLGLSFRKADWKPPQQIGAAEVSGTIKGEGYRIDKLLYRSSYGPWISANLYVPEPAREKMPGFIISHAHHTPKENGELQDMGVMWARAGCYVLVPDHLGHGERRQHPFKSKDDYDKPFQVSRQDYYFRYDVNLQLNLVGESLMGCLALDLMTGVSLLHAMPGIDNDKIILLGAVAGGGDPCAVTAALDERITCAAPFNFGGPQPETKFPLPEGVDFNYGGSGGWESTRNLAYSYRDGTLPWVIVGSIAPRRLIYGHEFAWDREHDPVWKRFEKIYGWYAKPENLSFAHGHGTLTSKDPPGSHCTHIGKTHRKQMHEALAKWFDIKLPGGEGSTDRHEAAELRCWTDELRAKFKPEPLREILATRRMHQAGNSLPLDRSFNKDASWKSEPADLAQVKVQLQLLEIAAGRLVPLLTLRPTKVAGKSKPTVLVISRAGKQEFIRQRAEMVAQLLDAGVTLLLPDFYNTGLTGSGNDFGRRSSATSRVSTLGMLGSRLHDEQAAEALALQFWYRREGRNTLALWCDSLVPPGKADERTRFPRDDDSLLPQGPDPLPQLVTWRVLGYSRPQATFIRGGIDSFHAAFEQPIVLLPQDSVALPTNHSDMLYRDMHFPVRMEQTVDALNRPVADLTKNTPQTAVEWMIENLLRE